MAGIGACTAAYTRPYFGPLVGARVDTLPGAAEVVVVAIADAVARRGFEVRAVSEEEGYLETDWYDTRENRAGGRYARNPLPIVRLRFFVDPLRKFETVVVSEAVHRTTLDPSQPEREVEALVPEGHAGRALLDSVLARVGDRLRGGGS